MKSAERALKDSRVLVCRPEPKASALCESLQHRGAEARALPMIAIEPIADTPQVRTLIQDFDRFGHVVVVSPVAAEFLLAQLDTWWPQRPLGQTWYAVGPGTARRLHDAGIECLVPHGGHDSESLLLRPELAGLKHEKVVLCGGEGGRPLLAERLQERGAEVEKLALYRRCRPDYTETQLKAALEAFDPHAIIALSGETLNNLLALGQNADRRLFNRLIVVPTERVAEQARSAGFGHTVVATALDDQALAATLEQALGKS